MWWPRNGCDGRLIAKILITTIQVNLVPILSETWRRQHKFAWIVVNKVFAINLPSQPFLSRHLGFHIFFHIGLLGGHTLFYSWAVFGGLVKKNYGIIKIWWGTTVVLVERIAAPQCIDKIRNLQVSNKDM